MMLRKRKRKRIGSIKCLHGLLLVLAVLLSLYAVAMSSVLWEQQQQYDDDALASEYQRLRKIYLDITSRKNEATHNGSKEETIHLEDDQANIQQDNQTLLRFDNLDLKHRAPCGRNKCFFRLARDIGYLVAPAAKARHVHEQWKAARYLKSQYPRVTTQLLLLEAPYEIEIDEGTARILNEHSDVGHNDNGFLFTPGKIVVQKNKVAPAPSVLFKCGNRGHMYSVWWFLAYHSVVTGQIASASSFRRQLHADLQLALELLFQEPWLAADFQVLIDPSGHVYLMDLIHVTFDRNQLANLWKDERHKRSAKEIQTIYKISEYHKFITLLFRGVDLWASLSRR